MKKQTKIAAVLSAAAFMMMVSGLPVYAASYGWVTEGDAKVYYDEDGYLTTDAWRKRGEDWFYLGEDGQIVKSAKIDEYYVDDEGKMVTNAWVELKNEEDPDSPETPDTFWYYFEKDGKSAVSKWVKFDSKWYYFDESGHMATGKTEIDGGDLLPRNRKRRFHADRLDPFRGKQPRTGRFRELVLLQFRRQDGDHPVR